MKIVQKNKDFFSLKRKSNKKKKVFPLNPFIKKKNI